MEISTHARAGINSIAMVDGNEASGFPALSENDVSDKNLIVVLPCYNDRYTLSGNVGDIYPGNDSIVGRIQYLINRIYQELSKANNIDCKILFATPHCAGKYQYVNADGYTEISGQSLKGIAKAIALTCYENNIPCCDLWGHSGINRYTWDRYSRSSTQSDPNYTEYELDENGEIIGETPLKYINGNSYYQIRDGAVVYEKYTGDAPYPYNADQLHCSDLGYAIIGDCIVGSVISNYGN